MNVIFLFINVKFCLAGSLIKTQQIFFTLIQSSKKTMKILAEYMMQCSHPLNNVFAGAVEKTTQETSVSLLPTDAISQPQQVLHAMPEVDTDRIYAMQAAIRNGELSLDCDLLAGAMMDYYRR